MDDRQNNTVLVTGGRGFMGRAVVNALLQAGNTVIALDQAGTSITPLRRSHEVLADITDAVQLRRVFESGNIGEVVPGGGCESKFNASPGACASGWKSAAP